MDKPSMWETAFRKAKAKPPEAWRLRQVLTGVLTIVMVILAGALFAYLGGPT